MKKHLNKKVLWLSILSMAVLGIFILLALGSDTVEETVPEEAQDKIERPLPEKDIKINYDVGGVEETVEILPTPTGPYLTTRTGKRDDLGRWQGTVKTVYSRWNRYGVYETETYETNYLDGKRHGLSKRYANVQEYLDTLFTCYYDDHRTKCCEDDEGRWVFCSQGGSYKSTGCNMTYTTAFQVLAEKYPWFLHDLNFFGFDSVYVEAYLDTLETIIKTLEFDEPEFDDEYEDVLDEMEKTPYDSIIVLNSNFAFLQGLELLKNNELRIAVIMRQRSEGNNTYNIVENVFPGYLRYINDMEISNQDFEGFCQDLDSCMDTYGALNPNDPLFPDSVDVHLIRALVSIMNTEDTTASSAKRMTKSTAMRNSTKRFSRIVGVSVAAVEHYLAASNPSEVGMVVLLHMMFQYSEGDIIRQSVKEAWLNRKGIIRIPTVATLFLSNNSATSVTLQGNVIEDGGGAVTSRGMAWATFYNPTMDDNIETHGTGTGIYNVTLSGLAEGTTYYARAWAVNSADTAYGNCISFVVAKPSGIGKDVKADGSFKIYPNPVSTTATISFNLTTSGNVSLNIIDMKGHQMLSKDLGLLPQGRNQIRLDLSGLQVGMYICRLSYGSARVTRRLVVAR